MLDVQSQSTRKLQGWIMSVMIKSKTHYLKVAFVMSSFSYHHMQTGINS